jgi:hypothetical protein
MEEKISELIKSHGLEESSEYVIIPFESADGKRKRCFLLKRRFIRIAFGDGHYADYPLADAIEAVLAHPELKLSEAMYLLHKNAAESSEEEDSAGQDAANHQPLSRQ